MTTTDALPDLDDPFARPEPVPAPADELIRNGRYYLPHPEKDGKMGYFTRVTNYAKHISDTYRLSLWQQRMAIAGICMDDGLRAIASTLDVTDDRAEFDKLVEQAKTRADRKGRAMLGSAVHKFTERLDAGAISVADVPSTWREDVAAYAEAMQRLGLKILCAHIGDAGHRLMSEVIVYEPTYQLVGTLDRIVEVTKPLTVKMMDGRRIALAPGDKLIFDLKTGARALEFGGQEHAIQFACYANATHMFDPEAKTWTKLPEDVRTDVGLVCHLPIGEHRATVAGVDIEAGWAACALVRQVKNWQNRKNLLSPVLEVDLTDAIETISEV